MFKRLAFAGIFIAAIAIFLLLYFTIQSIPDTNTTGEPEQSVPVKTIDSITPSPTATKAPTISTQLKSYTSNELGISFEYPSNFQVQESKENEHDQGETRHISVALYEEDNALLPVVFTAVTNNYLPDVGEGCCYWYQDLPTNISTIAQQYPRLQTNPESFWKATHDLKTITIGNRKALHFYHFTFYAAVNAEEAYLINTSNKKFPTVLIRGPGLLSIPYDDMGQSDQAQKQAIDKIDAKQFDESPNLQTEINLFNQIIRSIKYTN